MTAAARPAARRRAPLRRFGQRLLDASYLEVDFVLRSGRRSKFYLDRYLFLHAAGPAARHRRRARGKPSRARAVRPLAGPELGAVAIVAAVSLASGKPFVSWQRRQGPRHRQGDGGQGRARPEGRHGRGRRDLRRRRAHGRRQAPSGRTRSRHAALRRRPREGGREQIESKGLTSTPVHALDAGRQEAEQRRRAPPRGRTLPGLVCTAGRVPSPLSRIRQRPPAVSRDEDAPRAEKYGPSGPCRWRPVRRRPPAVRPTIFGRDPGRARRPAVPGGRAAGQSPAEPGLAEQLRRRALATAGHGVSLAGLRSRLARRNSDVWEEEAGAGGGSAPLRLLSVLRAAGRAAGRAASSKTSSACRRRSSIEHDVQAVGQPRRRYGARRGDSLELE